MSRIRKRQLFLIIAIIALGAAFGFTHTHITNAADDAHVSELQSQIQKLEEQIRQIQQQQDQYRQNLNGTQAQAKTLQSKISDLNGQIRYLEGQINLTNTQIQKTSAEIEETQGTIGVTSNKINTQKLAIAQSILYLARQDDESLVVSLLKNDNISDFLRQEQYVHTVSESLLGLVADLSKAKSDLESQKQNLEGKKGELENFKRQQGGQQSALTQTKNDTNSLLKSTKGQEAKYQAMLTDTEKLEQQVNVEIYNLQEELRKTIDPNSLPVARPGVFLWPVKGSVTQRYGCIETSFARKSYSSCNGGKGGFHDGLDIAAPYGTPILAPADGKVVAFGSAPYAYGTWVAIEHTSGLVTVYGHMSVRVANTIGQQVKAGETIGNIGTTGLTTGAHLHFMVFIPGTYRSQPSKISGSLPIGVPLNPSDYL